LYVNVILSPSKSTAPLAAHVSVEVTVAFAGLNVADFTAGAVLSTVTVFDTPDSELLVVPSLAKTVQYNLSPFANVADVKVLPFVGP
jgi:hypothetical protein